MDGSHVEKSRNGIQLAGMIEHHGVKQRLYDIRQALFSLTVEKRVQPFEVQMRRAGLVVDHTQCAVIEPVDAVGHTGELHRAFAFGGRECKSICDGVFQSSDSEFVMGGIVRQDAAT